MDEAHVKRLLEEQSSEIEALDVTTTDFRNLELPLARIKKIMKMEDEVQALLGGRRCMVSSEAPVVFAKACEIFILELTARAWLETEDNKRRTLQRSDVSNAVAKTDMYDFLIDVVPRDSSVVIAADTPDDRLLWQRRLAQHLFHSHPLAERLNDPPNKRHKGEDI